MYIVGYGVCGNGEAKRYLKATLDNFKCLCDDTIILANNIDTESRALIEKYGFSIVDDDREWGKNQHKLKEDFIRNHVAKLNPDITVCLDMDEVLVNVTREKIIKESEKAYALYVYIVNLWDKGWRKDWSFSNVRIWNWKLKDELGDEFWKFEERPLHCGLAPKWCYAINYQAPFVLEHYGLKKKKDRMAKVERYKKYDPRQVYRAPQYYQALETEGSEEYVRGEVIKWVEGDIASVPQPLNKKPPMKVGTKRTLLRREADNFIFDVDEKQVKFYLKQKYKGKGFTICV